MCQVDIKLVRTGRKWFLRTVSSRHDGSPYMKLWIPFVTRFSMLNFFPEVP